MDTIKKYYCIFFRTNCWVSWSHKILKFNPTPRQPASATFDQWETSFVTNLPMRDQKIRGFQAISSVDADKILLNTLNISTSLLFTPTLNPLYIFKRLVQTTNKIIISVHIFLFPFLSHFSLISLMPGNF